MFFSSGSTFKVVVLVATMCLMSKAMDHDDSSTLGPEKGWLIVSGGGGLTKEQRERFVALAGGQDASFVVIPTALPDNEIDIGKIKASFLQEFDAKQVTVLHTRDRVRANSDGFVEPLRHASGVRILGGRQWRLADAYLDTAVEREIKALLARGGVVQGGSAGASIQASLLVRGDPRGNEILVSHGHERGFGLLRNSAIDQHVNTRGREKDLDKVVASHPEVLGIGIDESAAIVVHGNSFFVIAGAVGSQVAIHDAKKHDGDARYFFLSSGQKYNLKTRSIQTDNPAYNYPFTMAVRSAKRERSQSGVLTIGTATLQSKNGENQEIRQITFECNASLYSIGGNQYPARFEGQSLKIAARELNTDETREYDCKYH